MSGITLKQIMSSINRYELVRLESEFGDEIDTMVAKEWMAYFVANPEKGEVAFDYMRTEDGDITIGINWEMYIMYFKEV